LCGRVSHLLVLALVLMLAQSEAAHAHGFGQRQDLPLPYWLYLFGINAVILATFVMVALSFDRRPAGSKYPRFDLLSVPLLRAVLTSRPLAAALRLLSGALFTLVVLSGLFGTQEAAENFAPTMVWITWWVGLGFFTALVGNLWPLVNPWGVVAGWLGAKAPRSRPPLIYPERLGIWPAVALYAAFLWIEVAFEGSSTPFNIAVMALAYSALTWGGMFLFGRETWLRSGEVFSVFFGVLARFAPTEVRVKGAEGVNNYESFARAKVEEREINIRPPAAGLAAAERAGADWVAFVVLLLAGVTYDSLRETEAGAALGLSAPVGLFLVFVLFLGAYLVFMRLSRRASGRRVSAGCLAGSFVYSLVPIAIAYQIAHYYSYLLVQGQGIFALFSDPFGWGWNLFGTAGYRIDAGVVDAAFVWYSQVALILAGHVVAVYLAHEAALRLFGSPSLAARSQYPMMVLMVLYTVLSLWLLSQPAAG
jgi:hypothetical protein